MRIDINDGKRSADIIDRSIKRLNKYISIDSIKIDVFNISATITAQKIKKFNRWMIMNFKIVRVTAENYSKFDDMIYWRMTGESRKQNKQEVNADIKLELLNPNLYIYALEFEDIFVGWISLIYLPKVGKFNGHGHVYIDELWIEPSYRKRGLSKI